MKQGNNAKNMEKVQIMTDSIKNYLEKRILCKTWKRDKHTTIAI